ncbi:MAG: hypothetical protein OEP95_14535, partial [Myxococcales bacterium]|nr:hypothetical protein [Myxococcales bacterium]
MRRRSALRFLAVWMAGLTLPALAPHADDLGRGDAAWANRARGEQDGRPESKEIRTAIRAYESALAERPESLEARWKLLRALHFAGDFVPSSEEREREVLDRARAVSEGGLARLTELSDSGGPLDELAPESLRERVERMGQSPEDVARFYFWSAINWGAWSRRTGLLQAVRQGVANRLERYAKVTIALEPECEEGGAFRLLGRLHAELPQVPFVSGWVDRDAAIPLLESGYEIAPDHPGNRLLLALTLLDLAPERTPQALDLLRQV